MRAAEALNAVLPQYCVDVVEPGMPACCHWVRCEIGCDLKFETAGLEAYCLANRDERVYDAFVVAAAVQFCDDMKRRPSTDWGRDFVLQVPVHDPDHWNSATVSVALHDALRLLTGDRWQITFKPRKASASIPRQRNFNLPDDTHVIIPFSDGLDSRAVAGLMELKHGKKLVRVRLGSWPLNGCRIGNQQIPFASVPYQVRPHKRRSVETSARSRGFKFALLSGIAAYLSGTKQVIVPESGQGAIGPVLVPVGQAYEDYRNHPLFTNCMETFLSALLQHEIHYTYPRLWHTKAETLAEFVENCPDGRNWTQTRSCWQGQRQVSVSGKMRQCGICAACILRRMSVYAADLTECKDSYVWEDLTAARFEDGAALAFKNKEPKGALYEYAIAGVLHLDHLASILRSSIDQAALNLRVFQLGHALGYPQAEAVRTKLERLLEKHTEEWNGFLDSLGPRSFVAQWVRRGEEHVPGGDRFR